MYVTPEALQLMVDMTTNFNGTWSEHDADEVACTSQVTVVDYLCLVQGHLLERPSKSCPRGCYYAMCDEELNYDEDCTCGSFIDL